MTTIQEVVAEKLKSQKGGKGDLALWDDLWTTFQKSGAEGVKALLERLVAPPDDDDEGRQHQIELSRQARIHRDSNSLFRLASRRTGPPE